MKTSAPKAYIVVAVANPTPEFPPVTSTVFPSNLRSDERRASLVKVGRKCCPSMHCLRAPRVTAKRARARDERVVEPPPRRA
jgi:hypothetical protein